MTRSTLWIRAEAPAKPALGEPCNGCGVCCLLQPCPVGMLISRRTQGACSALRWQAADRRYVCGLVAQPEIVLRWLPRPAARLVGRFARRLVSAGSGCDASIEVQRTPPDGA